MKIAVIDFKSKYTDLIIKFLNDNHIDYDIFENTVSKQELEDYSGIILTGSSDTVYKGGKLIDKNILLMKKPVLGICYGMQLIHYLLNGKVQRAINNEHGIYTINITEGVLFEGLVKKQRVKMAHYDEVVQLADGFVCTCSTRNCKIAGSENKQLNIYTTQFHPEHKDNDYGKEILNNFIKLCK